MDPIKKRKIEENGAVKTDTAAFSSVTLTPDDARKIVEPFTREQLLEIVQAALLRHPDVLDAVRSFANRDATQRKLFIRGLGWETTTEKLRAIFSPYGELDEAVVILDKVTGKSKGFGFITFAHVDGAIMALKEPSKQIDGRMTVTQLASSGNSGGGGPGPGGASGAVNSPMDVSNRKIYVSNVPYDMLSERLLQHFSMYGEIEEGPLGFDKATGKCKGFALFVYKTAEGARASLLDPVKNIDGRQLNCKLAIDGKRGNPPGAGAMGSMLVQGVNPGNGEGSRTAMPDGPYVGVGGSAGHYGGFGPGVGGYGLSSSGNQVAGSSLGAGGGFGSGMGGPYGGGSQFGGPMGSVYGVYGGSSGGLSSGAGLTGVAGGGFAGAGPLAGGGPGAGAGGAAAAAGGAGGGTGAGVSGGGGSGLGTAGRGSSLYAMPPGSAGMGSCDYPQGAHYNLSSGGGYPGQHKQPRVPPGGPYQGMPPYY